MFFFHQMLHQKKCMYRKCVTVHLCQVENNHTTGIKMKTFTYCLILVMSSSHQILSQTWDTQQSPQTLFFFCSVRAGLVHCSRSELASTLGTRYLDWSPLISWILLKAVHLLQFVKETLLQMWAWACFVQSNTEPAQSLLESSCYKQVNAAFSRSPSAHRSHVTLGDLILKQISLCSAFIYLF